MGLLRWWRRVAMPRYGLVYCPFHREPIRSCYVLYAHDQYHCFGCGRTGTLAELREARRRVGDDQ